MKRMKYRNGFVLPVAMAIVVVVGIVVASVAGYVSWAARATRVFLAKDRCRFAAQSAIEQAKAEIQSGFSDFLGAGGTSVRIDPKQAASYNWFDTVSGDYRTIGSQNPVTLQDPTVPINGCTVVVGIGKFVDHEVNSSFAAVPVVATATYVYPDGLSVSATIQETVCFATGQSKVFNYAYFVNNYGWMTGSTITINGDMRANGNISLSGSTVNGFVYGAINDEVGADGSISLKNSPKIRKVSDYRRSYATTQSRPDMDDYDTAGAYDAPATTTTISLPVYDAAGNVVAGTVGASSGKPICNQAADPLPMPFVSDLADYVEYAQEKNGTLSYPGYSYTDSAGATRTVSGGTVNAHFSGTGPSGDDALADKGSLVLIGTSSNPITINGPVVVDGDVIIGGYVKGQGTIYAGRNIHIVQSVRYKNPPSWSHPDSNDAQNESNNASKDMLGLVAKGNIVVGDSSSSTWYNSVGKYIDGRSSSSVVESYACDESDANIGYPAVFGGDYTAVERVGGNSFGKVRAVDTGETYVEYEPVYDWWGRQTGTKPVTKHKKAMETSMDRRYYETACDDAILSSFSSDVACIDAILYNNHGIFGTPNGGSSRFNLNGSLVCRDEALIFSGNGVSFNWDIRLMPKANNRVTSSLSLPVGPQTPYTMSWQEVPESLNPAYMALVNSQGD